MARCSAEDSLAPMSISPQSSRVTGRPTAAAGAERTSTTISAGAATTPKSTPLLCRRRLLRQPISPENTPVTALLCNGGTAKELLTREMKKRLDIVHGNGMAPCQWRRRMPCQWRRGRGAQGS